MGSLGHHQVMEIDTWHVPGLLQVCEGAPWQAAYSPVFNVDFGVALAGLGFWSHK